MNTTGELDVIFGPPLEEKTSNFGEILMTAVVVGVLVYALYRVVQSNDQLDKD